MGIKTVAMEQNGRMDGSFEPRVEDHRLLTGAGNFQDDEATGRLSSDRVRVEERSLVPLGEARLGREC